MHARSSLHLFALAGLLTIGGAACGEAFTTSTGSGGASSGSGSGASGGSGSNTGGTTGTGGSAASGTGGTGGSPCATPDGDGDGVTVCDGDCDDADPTSFPGNPEICGDARDNDCKNGVDDSCKGIGTYVSTNNLNLGSDSNPGTQEKPLLTVAQGIINAQTIGNGQPVFVAAGHYSEDVVLVEGVTLLGGHDPVTWVRDPSLPANESALLLQGFEGLYADPTITRDTVVDGFRIQGKNNANNGQYGAAVTLAGGSPTLSNNVINAGTQSGSVSAVGVLILAPTADLAGALIDGNQINGALAGNNSVCVTFVSPSWPPPVPGAIAEISRNQITAGNGKYSHGIDIYAGGDGTKIFDNDIMAGSSNNGDSWGIVVGSSPLGTTIVIDSNRINLDQGSVGVCSGIGNAFGWCGGIDSQAAQAVIVNNVVFGTKNAKSTAVWLHNPEMNPQSLALNSNYLDGGGVLNQPASISAAVVLTVNLGTNTIVGRIRNNILAGGISSSRFGVYEDSLLGKTCHPEALDNNDFFLDPADPNEYFYRSWDGTTPQKLGTMTAVNMLFGAANNFAGDPQVDASFHLASGSVCVDKGTAAEAPAKDMDGEDRPKDGGYDVGPDER